MALQEDSKITFLMAKELQGDSKITFLMAKHGTSRGQQNQIYYVPQILIEKEKEKNRIRES